MKSKQGNHHALRHGLYAREAVLPWEDAEEFAALHGSFVDELHPQGPLEEDAVREVTELHWRKRRLALGYLLPFYREMPSPELTEAAKKGPIALANYLAVDAQRPRGTITATSTEILDFIKGRIAGVNGSANQPNAVAVVQSPNDSPRNIVELAYDPACLELRLKIETAIDNRIAKAMSRLVGLKEYKRMYADKATVTIAASPPIAPAEKFAKPVAPPEPNQAPIRKRQWGDPE